jgi:hypothetical protein
MDVVAALAPWTGFFTTAAGASAVLLGLVFVAMSIHYDPATFDRHLVAMVTESAVPFFYATIVALVMLIPASPPWVPTGGLFVVGLLASLNSGVPLFGRYFGNPGAAYHHERPLTFLLPWFAALALLPASLALLQWPVEGLYLVGFLVLAFVAFGMQNAWDALLRRDLRQAFRAPTPPAAAPAPTAPAAASAAGPSDPATELDPAPADRAAGR